VKNLNFFIKKNTDNITFISGLTRSGKSILCPIVSSFRNHEMFIMNSIAENILHLNLCKNIHDDAAKHLIKLTFNERFHDLTIGRNLNLKAGDYTNVKKHVNFKDYDKRINTDDSVNLFKKIKKKNFVVMFHDLMVNLKIIFKCYPKVKIINITRNPIDLILDWANKKYDLDFYKDVRNTTLCYTNKKLILPYYLNFSSQKISKKNNKFENIINQIYILEKLYEKNFKMISGNYKKNILNLTFDNLTIKTSHVIKEIEFFLKNKKTIHTKKILLNENCPRKINLKTRKENEIFIKKKINKSSLNKLRYLMNRFDNLNRL
jgi:hypothetical protein